MRNIRTVALGLLVLAGSAAVVSAQAPDRPARQRQHQGMKGMGQGQGQRGIGQGQLARGLFRGIQLTEAERTALKSVREKYATQTKAQRETMRPQMDAMREARQRGDTAAMRAAREKMQQHRTQNLALVEQAQRDMRAVLTPEHQAQFDKNLAEMKERMARRGDRPARNDAPRKRPGGRGQGRGF